MYNLTRDVLYANKATPKMAYANNTILEVLETMKHQLWRTKNDYEIWRKKPMHKERERIRKEDERKNLISWMHMDAEIHKLRRVCMR